MTSCSLPRSTALRRGQHQLAKTSTTVKRPAHKTGPMPLWATASSGPPRNSSGSNSTGSARHDPALKGVNSQRQHTAAKSVGTLNQADAVVHSKSSDGVTGIKRHGTPRPVSKDNISKTVVAVILAGGARENALTRWRAMPALELGSSARLVDIPISNCFRSNIYRTFVLTQFNSHSLNCHLAETYPPVTFGAPYKQGFVDILACSQTNEAKSWYQGSADAVRRNLLTICEPYRGVDPPEDILVLSGQAVYHIDLADLIRTHRQKDADITIGTHNATDVDAGKKGVVRVDSSGRVEEFLEKPKGQDLQGMAFGSSDFATDDEPFEASMGIYCFKRDVLMRLLHERQQDGRYDVHFGADVVPHALRAGFAVQAHHHTGYWRDINSLLDYYTINMELTQQNTQIRLDDVTDILATRGRALPPAILHNSVLENVILGEGSILQGCEVRHSVVGTCNYISEGCRIEDSVLLGNSSYQNEATRNACKAAGETVVGIGPHTLIRGALVDFNASIGANCEIANRENVSESHQTKRGFIISEGVVTIVKDAVIPDYTVI